MFQTYISRIGWFIFLLLLQVLVFNHVHIFGYATPMPYAYFLLILPLSTPRWLYVVCGFLLGLCIDLFSNTLGVASGALCLAGILSPFVLRLFIPSDNEDDSFEPSAHSMEWSGFLKYAFIIVLIHCSAFFILENFSFYNWQALLINIGGSSILTTLFIAAMERIRIN